jgi:hypothetical protein
VNAAVGAGVVVPAAARDFVTENARRPDVACIGHVGQHGGQDSAHLAHVVHPGSLAQLLLIRILGRPALCPHERPAGRRIPGGVGVVIHIGAGSQGRDPDFVEFAVSIVGNRISSMAFATHPMIHGSRRELGRS